MSSVSLSAHDGSFAAGLVEAASLALAEGGRVMLIAYYYPPPAPLSEVCSLCVPFATAMLLSAQSSELSLAAFTLKTASALSEDMLADAYLERLRVGNPVARALPVLRTIARGETRQVVLPYLRDAQLAVMITPPHQ